MEETCTFLPFFAVFLETSTASLLLPRRIHHKVILSCSGNSIFQVLTGIAQKGEAASLSLFWQVLKSLVRTVSDLGTLHVDVIRTVKVENAVMLIQPS